MQRRWWLLIVVAAIVLAVFLAIILRKSGLALQKKKAKAASLAHLLTQAKDAEARASTLEAKSIYQQLVNEFPNAGEIMIWQKKIEEMNIKLLFSPVLTAHSKLYEIKPADTLDRIAREFNTTVELIMRSNKLTSDKILPGRKIKVWTAPFVLVIDKSQNTLILKSEEEIIKTYTVSTGANNSTPTGTFKVINKLTQPTWFKAGAVVPPESPENILGSRWLGFNLPGYGIHGTTEPQNLGKQLTQGCIRMSNPDIEELYAIIPTGTEVIIVD